MSIYKTQTAKTKQVTGQAMRGTGKERRRQQIEEHTHSHGVLKTKETSCSRCKRKINVGLKCVALKASTAEQTKRHEGQKTAAVTGMSAAKKKIVPFTIC